MHALECQLPGHRGRVLGAFQGWGWQLQGSGQQRAPDEQPASRGHRSLQHLEILCQTDKQIRAVPDWGAGTGCRPDPQAPWHPVHLRWLS